MATGGGDEGGIFWGESTQDAGGGPSSSSVNRVKYREFIRNFRLDEEYVYREALRSAIVTRQQMMEVDIDHLMEFDEELTNELLSKPGVHLPIFEKAALEAAVSVAIVEEGDEDVHLQITLISSKQPISIRKLLSNQVSNLVTIPGIVISTSRVKAKARAGGQTAARRRHASGPQVSFAAPQPRGPPPLQHAGDHRLRPVQKLSDSQAGSHRTARLPPSPPHDARLPHTTRRVHAARDSFLIEPALSRRQRAPGGANTSARSGDLLPPQGSPVVAAATSHPEITRRHAPLRPPTAPRARRLGGKSRLRPTPGPSYPRAGAGAGRLCGRAAASRVRPRAAAQRAAVRRRSW